MTDPADTEPSGGTRITVRYWASARAAAGVDSDGLDTQGPTTLADVLRRVRERHPDQRFRAVLDTCSLMVEDRPVTGHDPEQVDVRPGESVEVLPPFAGG
jgi:molybdopterin synthase sulfur carrier subunit